jgi:hypothetical protein
VQLLCSLVAVATLYTFSVREQPATQPVTLKEVLSRAGAYVTEFERRFSGLIAEEQYVQDVRRSGHGPDHDPMHIALRSDLLLVRGEPAARWVQYRDVFEVDGAAVRDRRQRLTELLTEGRASREAQLRSILAESARYNIGDIERNINVPLLALQFLEPANQPRFRFTRAKERTPSVAAAAPSPTSAFRVTVEMWAIQYEERETPTIIRSTTRRDVRSRGRFWIDPETGRVLMTELVAEDRNVRATIDVSYQSEPLVDMLVPIEMREHYEGRRDGSLIEGRATYGRFRATSQEQRR